MTGPRKGIRVLHLLAPTQGAGLEQVVAMLAVAQEPQGAHVVLVLTPREADNHPFARQLSEIGVPFSQVVVRGRSYLQEYRELSAILSRLRPSILHTHGYRADLIGLILARRHRVPMVSTVHGFTGATLRIRNNERVQCLILRAADAVIAVSAPLQRRLSRSGIPTQKIHFVANGFLPISPVLDRSQSRATLGIDEKALTAGWVGRLSPEKGADVMLDALSRTPSTWQLEMIGDGPQREELRQTALRLGVWDRVRWHGRVTNAGGLLTAFDAFVLSSRTEGTPIALLEAMHAGVPIVATSVGGVPNVLDASAGILVESERPERIADALAQIEKQPAETRKRVAQARRRVVEVFGPVRWVAQIDAVYEAATTSSRRASPRRA